MICESHLHLWTWIFGGAGADYGVAALGVSSWSAERNALRLITPWMSGYGYSKTGYVCLLYAATIKAHCTYPYIDVV